MDIAMKMFWTAVVLSLCSIFIMSKTHPNEWREWFAWTISIIGCVSVPTVILLGLYLIWR